MTAQTAAGLIPITGIPFDVNTAFPGIAAFGNKAEIPASEDLSRSGRRSSADPLISAVPIVRGGGGGTAPIGGSEYLRWAFRWRASETVRADSDPVRSIDLVTVLQNPAPLNLNTDTVNLDVIYRGVTVGKAFINPLNLIPGSFRRLRCSRLVGS